MRRVFDKRRPFLVGALLLVIGCGPQSAPSPQPSPTRTPSPAASRVPFFIDVDAEAGLRYRWTIPGPRPATILQTIGNGCAFLDYNNDGNLDILLIGPQPRLYRGDGKGHFTEPAPKDGLPALNGHFLGCAVGDYDNDGFPDIYLSGYRNGVLLHNENGHHFTNVSRQAGIAPQPWGSSCSFVDIDGDGLLDLFIGNYVVFGPKTEPQLCNLHGILASCGPGDYRAEHGVLYRNLSNGRFARRTGSAPLGMTSGKTLGVAAAPYGSPARPTLAIANDQMPGDLLSLRDGQTVNDGQRSGFAYAGDGKVYGGMGVDWGDYDNDGQLDLAVATYQGQAKIVFRQQDGVFTAQDTRKIGMFSAVPYVTFGLKWLDVDNDGWLDLILANGHVQDNADEVNAIYAPGQSGSYRQPTLLFHNVEGQRFDDATAHLARGAEKPIVGRGVAVGDYDNDGRQDVLIVDSEGAPLLLHNEAPNSGHFLSLTLQGTGRSNRDAFGAMVTVSANGRSWVRHCHADGSYLSSSDKRLHFGLGQTKTPVTVAVTWPDGTAQTWKPIPVDTQVTLKQGVVSPVSVLRQRR